MSNIFPVNKDVVFIYKSESFNPDAPVASKLFKSSDGGKSFKEVYNTEPCDDIIGSKIIDEEKLFFYTQWICEGPGAINIYNVHEKQDS